MELFDRWCVLWERIRARGDPAIPYRRIMNEYASPERRKHTARWLAHKLDQFDDVATQIVNPYPAELGLWLSRYAYRPWDDPNGLLASEHAQHLIAPMDISVGFNRKVRHFVRTTFYARPDSLDGKLLQDLITVDLAADWECVRRDERRLRDEWRAESFCERRIAHLGRLRTRPYLTRYFSEYTERTERNISRLLARYRSPLQPV